MINQMLLDLLASITLTASRTGPIERVQIFEKIFGYEGIKRTFVRSLASKEPVHLLLVGPPGQAKTMFLKCILETFGEKKAFFTVGGNASKSGLIDVLFELRPKYLLIDEIEHLRSEYQTILLSLMASAAVAASAGCGDGCGGGFFGGGCGFGCGGGFFGDPFGFPIHKHIIQETNQVNTCHGNGIGDNPQPYNNDKQDNQKDKQTVCLNTAVNTAGHGFGGLGSGLGLNGLDH